MSGPPTVTSSPILEVISPLSTYAAFLARNARTPASWVPLASAYDLERWATDDLSAVPMPHLIGLRSIYPKFGSWLRRGGNLWVPVSTVAGAVNPAAGVPAGSVVGRADIFAVTR
jgi:hypothetical protein